MMRETLLSPIGTPCNPPPWGTIAALDLQQRKILWEVPLGTTDDIIPLGIALRTGTPSFGGPVATAGGLVFIGATMDRYLRAFDAADGTELWRGRLPASAMATPMTYIWHGRQYVVVAAGGHGEVGNGDERCRRRVRAARVWRADSNGLGPGHRSAWRSRGAEDFDHDRCRPRRRRRAATMAATTRSHMTADVDLHALASRLVARFDAANRRIARVLRPWRVRNDSVSGGVPAPDSLQRGKPPECSPRRCWRRMQF